jgi:hypothetical protein
MSKLWMNDDYPVDEGFLDCALMMTKLWMMAGYLGTMRSLLVLSSCFGALLAQPRPVCCRLN